jgi:hypothetical protein
MRLMPTVSCRDGLDALWHNNVTSRVEFLGIETLPPLTHSVGFSQGKGVVALTSQRTLGIVAIRSLQPMPGMAGVVGDPKRKPRCRITFSQVPTMSFCGPRRVVFQAWCVESKQSRLDVMAAESIEVLCARFHV